MVRSQETKAPPMKITFIAVLSLDRITNAFIKSIDRFFYPPRQSIHYKESLSCLGKEIVELPSNEHPSNFLGTSTNGI